MFKIGTVFSLSALGAALALLAFVPAAQAGSRSVQVGQVPEVGSGTAGVGMNTSVGFSSPSINTAINVSSSVASPASMTSTINNASNVNVTTNIDNTKTVSVDNSINGENVAYGWSGANTLNVIESANNYGAGASADSTQDANAAVNDALLAAQLQN